MKVRIFKRNIGVLFALVALFSFNISYADFDPNSTITTPSGTVYSGLIPALINWANGDSESAFPRSTNLTGGSPGFTGPSGFNINGFTGGPANDLQNTKPSSNTSGVSCRLGQAKTFREVIINFVVGCVLTPTVYLIIGASVIAFLWGVYVFITAEGDDKQTGRQYILWGIVGLFVMVSVWGLVNILTSTFNLNNNSINYQSLTR